MLKLKIESAIATSGVAGITKRELNQELKGEFDTAGRFWHRQYRQRHFEARAYTLYGYQRRKPGYVKRKRKKLGHNKPLVFTGTSERLARARTIRATSNGVVVSMSVPVLNMKSRQSTIDKRAELEIIADQEMSVIEQRYERGLTRRIQRLGGRPPRSRDARGRFV